MVSVYSEYLEGDPDPYYLNPHDRGGVIVGGAAGAGGGGKARHVNINAKPINSLDKVTVPISLVLTVMVSYICGGAILFGQWEGKFLIKYLISACSNFCNEFNLKVGIFYF